MHRHAGLLTLGLVLTACASPAALATNAKPASPAGHYRAWVRQGMDGSFKLALVDLPSGRVVRTLPDGSLTPDGTRLYTVDGRSVEAIDTGTGTVLGRRSIPSGFGLPVGELFGQPQGGLSPDGAWLALQSLDQGDQGRLKASHYLVLDTAFTRAPVRVDFTGRWDFDGLSNGGEHLYLLQYVVQPPDGAAYHVRRYDVPQRRLVDGVIVDKRESPNGTMTGTRLASHPSRDGAWLYSLYAFGRSGPFIHTLNLEGYGPPAWCIDLPGGGGDDPVQLLWSLSADPTGTRIWAVNAGLGIVAEVAPGNPPAVVRTARFAVTRAQAFDFFGLVLNADAKRILNGGAAVSPDGSRLFAIGDDGVYVIDLQSLKLIRHDAAGIPLDSLAISTDGAALVASSAEKSRIVVLDARTGGMTTIVSPGQVTEVLRADPGA